MPDIVNDISYKTKECEQKLDVLGPGMPITEMEKMQLLHKLITEFCDS